MYIYIYRDYHYHHHQQHHHDDFEGRTISYSSPISPLLESALLQCLLHTSPPTSFLAGGRLKYSRPQQDTSRGKPKATLSTAS